MTNIKHKQFLDTKSTDVASWYAVEDPGIIAKYDELWKQAAAEYTMSLKETSMV